MKLEEVLDWNICPSVGWAELVLEAYNKGYLWNKEAIYCFRDDLKEPEHIRQQLCGNKFFGPYAWVDSKGRIMPVSIGGHDQIAEVLLGWTTAEVERKFARVSFHTKHALHSMKYVDNLYQTDEMLLSVQSVINKF